MQEEGRGCPGRGSDPPPRLLVQPLNSHRSSPSPLRSSNFADNLDSDAGGSVLIFK